jgi:hypothetical protein
MFIAAIALLDEAGVILFHEPAVRGVHGVTYPFIEVVDHYGLHVLHAFGILLALLLIHLNQSPLHELCGNGVEAAVSGCIPVLLGLDRFK